MFSFFQTDNVERGFLVAAAVGCILLLTAGTYAFVWL